MSARGPSSTPAVIRLEGEGSFLVISSIDEPVLSEVLRRHRTAGPDFILKRNRGTLVTRVRIAAGEIGRSAALDVVVKELEIPWRWRLIRLAGRKSPFAGHFETERRLHELGIRAPRTMAASLRAPGGREFLVTETVEDAASLRDLLWLGPGTIDDPSERSLLLRDVGAWLRAVHDRGVWQRDMKSNNILLRRGSRPPSFYLVDVTGVRFLGRPLDEARRIRNLSQLLDLPLALDREAPPSLLAGYLGDRDRDAAAWEERVAALVRERRETRRRRTGLAGVDEEYSQGRAMGKR